tara:strand:- start:104 stop:688 length:585 start_codon:yes stop_codon:yes gene_type:complete
MAVSYFDRAETAAFKAGIQPRSKESLNWFRTKLKSLRVNRNALLKDENTVETNKPLPGRMFMYFYDPKNKDTLPYYDRFPLIFLVEGAPGGFYGLNLHYLDPINRAKLFDQLIDYATSKKYSDRTRLRLKYNLLKGASKLSRFQPCFKHYLTEHITSRISEIKPTEWEVALFMPTESFVKKSKSAVHNLSKKQF